MPEEIPVPEVLPEVAPSIFPYEVEGVGIVEAHDGATYVVRVPSGSVYGYASQSGTPSPELAAEEIAYAIANPPTFAPSVPESVRAAALRYVLTGAGLRVAVENAIALADQNARDAWEYETTIRRDHDLVAGLAVSLDLSSAEVDALFIQAAAL